jgi:predicted phosphodiesterase
VSALSQLRPLLDGADAFVFNGDTLDTRPSRNNERTARMRSEVLDYFGSFGIPVTFLTGNHDPNISRHHSLELDGGRVLVTHGDLLFDTIVPWSSEAKVMKQRVAEALAALPAGRGSELEGQLEAFRSAAGSVSQRHQEEPNPVRYALRLASDTVWPPHRAFSMFKAWRDAPGKAAALARRHRPGAQCIVIGHTHRPGVWRAPSGVAVVNNGSFCRPFGGLVTEVRPGNVRVRRVECRRGDFHPGHTVATIPLS